MQYQMQNKKKTKKFQVKNILDDVERQKLVYPDDGFYIYQTICNSSAYVERQKDAFTMKTQLGYPSLLISQSASETKWL